MFLIRIKNNSHFLDRVKKLAREGENSIFFFVTSGPDAVSKFDAADKVFLELPKL